MKNSFVYRLLALFLVLLVLRCNDKSNKPFEETKAIVEELIPDLFFGIDINEFDVETKKIKRGDTFGKIIEDNGIDYPRVYKILQAIKGKVSVRKLTIGKSYSLFYSKDSIPIPEFFVYHPGPQSFILIHLRDSLYGEQVKKPVRLVELEASEIGRAHV